MQSRGLQSVGIKAQCATSSSGPASRPLAGAAPHAARRVRASRAAAAPASCRGPACRRAGAAAPLRAGPNDSEFDVDSAPPPEQLGVELGPREDDVSRWARVLRARRMCRARRCLAGLPLLLACRRHALLVATLGVAAWHPHAGQWDRPASSGAVRRRRGATKVTCGHRNAHATLPPAGAARQPGGRRGGRGRRHSRGHQQRQHALPGAPHHGAAATATPARVQPTMHAAGRMRAPGQCQVVDAWQDTGFHVKIPLCKHV